MSLDTICLVTADSINLFDADTIYLDCPGGVTPDVDPTPFLTSHRLNATADYTRSAQTARHLEGRRSYRRRP